MSNKEKERQGFLLALKEDEDDLVTRAAFADWLMEHDEPEEAERVLDFPRAKKWMLEWVESINYPDEYDEDTYEPKPGSPRTHPHDYRSAIDAGYGAVSRSGYCFGSDAGSEYFWEGGLSARQEWFRNWSVLTGVPVPEAVIEQPFFRCAC